MQDLKGLKIGYALTGSFCTFKQAFELIEKLITMNAEIFPIISFNVQTIPNRFIKPQEIFRRKVQTSNYKNNWTS